ncbi:hypothetical protein E0L01_05470 [Megamonas funiformis]|uniref:hypothetical protein n=1 Tax=Megamonas funiformis TaxID=437897 RepID=UPI001431FE97|nr:hypothetical protein [Megamonas funiformis]NJE28216.1 hypothetical protein [Megamonas funiformis]
MKISSLQKYLDALMYKDKVTIKRSQIVLLEDGSDKYNLTEIYVDIPCKLSQNNRSILSDKNDRATSISEDYILTLSPNYELKPNDVAIITTNLNQKLILDIIKPFKYPTHMEVSVRKKSDA